MAQSGIQPHASCFEVYNLLKTGCSADVAEKFSYFDKEITSDEQDKLVEELSSLGSKGFKKVIKFVLFKLSDDRKNIIVSYISKNDKYDDFVAKLPEDEGRWAVYDLAYTTKDGRPSSKLVFYSWVSDNAPPRYKMIHSSSKTALKAILTGIGGDIQATDYDEVEFEEVVKSIS